MREEHGRRVLSWALPVVTMLAQACGHDAAPQAPRPPRPPQIERHAVRPPASMPPGSEMLVDGVSIGAATGGEIEADLSYRAGALVSALAIRMPTVCGPRDLPVVGNDYGVVMLAAPAVPNAHVYVDNDGGPAATLGVGAITQAIEADSATDVRMAAPPCDAAPHVTLDGADIGTLPAARSADWPAYVIALQAARCYRYETVRYAEYGGSEAPPAPVVYGGRVFAVDAIDHFLERAPRTIEVLVGASERATGERTSLVRSACRNAVAPLAADAVLSAGDVVQIESHDHWYAGHVVAPDPSGARVHYDGWSDDSDEVVPRSRLLGPYHAP